MIIEIDQLQSYVQGLIEAEPHFAAIGLTTIAENGTREKEKIPALEAKLAATGLAVVVWRITAHGLIDESKAGLSNEWLSIMVVINENVLVNRGNPFAGDPENQIPAVVPTGITALQALTYVRKACQGQPANTPPGTPILPQEEPFTDFGINAGLWTVVANFKKQYRLVPN